MVTSASLSLRQRRIVWSVRILLILAFSAAGLAKLASVSQMVQVFEAIGIGQWLRYLTGAVEIVGVALLIAPATVFFGALLLAVTMIVAAGMHLTLIGGNPGPAILLALLSIFVAWRLRPRLLFNSPFSSSRDVT